MRNQVIAKIIVPFLLSFLFVVMVSQQLCYVLTNTDTFAMEDMRNANDEDSDDNAESFDFFKLLEQDKSLHSQDLTTHQVAVRSKAYAQNIIFVLIESVTGVIDAPPPESFA